MTVVTAPPQIEASVQRTYMYWSLDRYQRAIESGVLGENDRVELLFGAIINKMPINSPHAAGVSRLERYFRRLGDGYLVRTENPVLLPPESMPEPDCVIVPFREDFYARAHPNRSDIHLIVEVADSTIATDRTLKAKAYALADLAEYWIINIKDRQVELHLQPDAELGTYQRVEIHKEGAAFSSPFAGQVTVADLLPPLPEDQS
jgi:Uma2 family endonuclease